MRTTRSLSLLWLLLLTLFGVACSPRSFSFEQSTRDYTVETVTEVGDEAGPGDALGQPVADAADLRHDALVALRSSGGVGAQLADLLTETFPGEDRSVPHWATEATFEGTPAWIVVEVWGSRGGDLERTRLWVFDRSDGRILFSAAIR